MKRVSLFFTSIVLFLAATAQNAIPQKISDQKLVHILNNMTSREVFSGKDLVLSVYVVSNPSGSAHIPGNDEVTENVYFGISEDGEAPRQRLYVVSNLYSPGNIKFERDNSNELIVSLQYTDLKVKKGNARKKLMLKFTIDKVSVIN